MLTCSATGSHVDDEQVTVVDVELAETDHTTFFTTTAIYFQLIATSISEIIGLSVASITSLMESFGHMWIDHYPLPVFINGPEIMPRCTFGFITACLLAFVEIKAQGNTKFPFQTHHQAIMFSVSSLLIYGFASAAEHVVSTAGLDHTSIYAIVGRYGRIGSLCILVASLASLFYV